jgi:CheY-like chemotaxis protein
MTEDVRARLFEPYFTTQEIGRGTGLGLTIVHRVVSELDGHVEVESCLNKGSTFQVRLPRSEPALEMPPTVPEEPVETGGEQILLVDDDPAVLATATALLESLGYTVNPFGDPGEALAILQQTDPDDPGFHLIVTDLTMPKIDGLQLAREATFLLPKIPVIVVTGFGDECEKAMRAAPIAAFLHKPITRADLGKAVRAVIDERAKSHQ